MDPSAQGWDTAVSFEQLCEREYGFREETGQAGLDEILEKRSCWQPCGRNWPSWKRWTGPSFRWPAMVLVKQPSARKWASPKRGQQKKASAAGTAPGAAEGLSVTETKNPAGNFLAGFLKMGTYSRGTCPVYG